MANRALRLSVLAPLNLGHGDGMFKTIHKNKKGISLVELLVTIVILGFVLTLTSQLTRQMWRMFKITEERWSIQSAVQLACRKFETNRDSLVNAYQADLLYDPVVAQGIKVHDDDTFEWIGGTPCVMPAEGTADNNNPYTYMFSTPAYATDGTFLGSYLFIREYGQGESVRFLDEEGMGDVPVEVLFRIAKTAPALDAEGEEDTSVKKKYLTQTVEIELRSGKTNLTNYSVVTQFTLVNVSEGKEINYLSGGLVFEPEWLGGADGTAPVAGPVGWADETLNAQFNSGFPTNSKALYKDESGAVKEVVLSSDFLKQNGNVMRFVSPTAFHATGDASELASSANLASCLTSFAFSDSSALSEFVLGSLRGFRDNILAGTTVGDWIIHEYYNTWSPFLIEKAGFLKPVYRAVLIPISFVCEIITDIQQCIS